MSTGKDSRTQKQGATEVEVVDKMVPADVLWNDACPRGLEQSSACILVGAPMPILQTNLRESYLEISAAGAGDV